MRHNILIVFLLLALTTAMGAERNSPARVQAFAKLPNWNGIWLSAAWPLDISGRVPGGEAKLREGLQLILQPPYNAEWMAKYQEGIKDTAAMTARSATYSGCRRSFPSLLEGPWMFQLMVLPEETLFLFENGQVRHIYTDGRQHPARDDLWPTILGDSIGHWEGGALRIDTVARNPAEPLTVRAWVSLLSEQAHFTERVRLVDPDTLEDQLIIEDPVAFASPWTITLRFTRERSMSRFIEYNCVENDRNPVVDGKIIITQPN
jgi:hypothetical protein